MRYGISIPPFTDVPTLVDMAVEAEAAGWDGVFLWDHVVWDRDTLPDVHDPWVLLGALASRTDRVVLGPLVTPLARRRPWIVAKHLVTLDHLSGGRAVMGVGLGAPPDADFADLGEPAGDRERATILDDALALMDGLLRGPVDEPGGRYAVRTELRPRPVQDPRPPVWVAAIAPRRWPLRRATRWDGVVPLGPHGPLTPDELETYLAGTERPESWEVVVPWAPEVPAAEYVDAGATWLVESTWPEEGWVSRLRGRIADGPG